MFFTKFDKALTTFLAGKRLKMDELFVIVCFNLGKLDLLKDFLNGRTGDQITAYLQSLERKQLIKKLTPELADFDWDNYELTNLADEIFDEISPNITDELVENIIPVKDVPTERDKLSKSDEFAAFMLKFVALWPQGIRNAGGEPLKSNIKDFIKKMIGFRMKYKNFTDEVILEATKRYIELHSKNGYAYCSAGHYFISKNGDSKLATECEDVVNGAKKENNSGDWINHM